MATKGKESPSPKEKRVTSPSHPRKTTTAIFQQRKSPGSSKQPSPVERNDSNSTATSERLVPNYLKPTISSGLDLSSHHLKKIAPTSTCGSKPNLTRRKSLDRPLPPSPVQKTRTSPSPKERTLRSSSFTTRSTTSKKALPDRLSNASKDVGKEQALHARPSVTKKLTNTIKKPEKDQCRSPKEQLVTVDSPVEEIHDIDVLVKHAVDHEDLDTSIITHLDEEISNVVNENETPKEVLVVEDEGHVNLPQHEEGSDESEAVEEVKMVESFVRGDEDQPIPPQNEKPEEILEVEESSKQDSECKQQVYQDSDEVVASEAKVEDEQKCSEEVEPKEGGDRREVEEVDEKEEGIEGSNEDHVQLQETENAKDEDVKEIKQDVENEEMKQQVSRGKKVESSVSNDVIEETATKLREQRKNKVKALAGAFETVISLQDTK